MEASSLSCTIISFRFSLHLFWLIRALSLNRFRRISLFLKLTEFERLELRDADLAPSLASTLARRFLRSTPDFVISCSFAPFFDFRLFPRLGIAPVSESYLLTELTRCFFFLSDVGSLRLFIRFRFFLRSLVFVFCSALTSSFADLESLLVLFRGSLWFRRS